jgi:DNA-binding MarR family transcriptional regulator
MKKPLLTKEYMQNLLDEIGHEKYYELYKEMYDLESLGCLIFRVNRLMVNLLNRRFKEAGHDITIEQFQVLLHLWEHDGLLQSDLAECTQKDKASLARTLDIMERKNLIIRIIADSDRRQKQVYLTNKGKTLKDVLLPQAIGQHMEYFEIIGEDNAEITRGILKQLIEKFQD